MGLEKNSNTDTPYVYQVTVKNAHRTDRKVNGPQKIPTKALNVKTEGCDGDYNDYHTKHKKSTNCRAISLITTHLLDTFNDEGWPVLPGDLGENITVGGYIEFEIDAMYQIGTTVIQITELIDPCNKLLFLPYVGRENKTAFNNMLKGRRGWYDKVLIEGIVVPNDKVELYSVA